MTAAELLSLAGFIEGRHAMAFPSFGSERMGAPVVANCRIDVARIATYEPVEEPDAVIVADPTLLHSVDVFGGLVNGGLVLLNTSRRPAQLGLSGARWPIITVPATELALRHTGRPLPNSALLGAFAGLCAEKALAWPGAGVVSLRAVELALDERFARVVGSANAAAAREGFEVVRKFSSAEQAEPARA